MMFVCDRRNVFRWFLTWLKNSLMRITTDLMLSVQGKARKDNCVKFFAKFIFVTGS